MNRYEQERKNLVYVCYNGTWQFVSRMFFKPEFRKYITAYLRFKVIIIAMLLVSCTKDKNCSIVVKVGESQAIPYELGTYQLILKNGDTIYKKGNFKPGEIVCYE